jgi:protein involved in polysaccharide export with SLBB domain
MTLYEAVARAGGPTALGSSRPSRWEVRRKGDNDKYVELKGKKDLRIQPGDVILVKESFF